MFVWFSKFQNEFANILKENLILRLAVVLSSVIEFTLANSVQFSPNLNLFNY